MPTERDVDERHYFWCPKWYWPFAVCSRVRRVHKWCYNFAWVRETGYGVASHLEGCENGTLYSWTEFSVNLFGSSTYAGGEMCFDSPRSSDGRCDASRTGLQASGLSPSEPYVSDIDADVRELRQKVVETGSYEFTLESGGLCQMGKWPWSRTLHEQVITASVDQRFATVQWNIGGIQVVNNSGTVSTSAYCRWPFPLPKGRSENRVVHVRYEVITENNKSTLKVYNDPADGSYSISIGMNGFDEGKVFKSSYTNEYFSGETCDFDPEKVKEKEKCLRHLRDDYAKSRTPKLGEPVINFSEEIWGLVREERREAVNTLLEIIASTYQVDPQTAAQAINQLELELGFEGVSRLITVKSVDGEHNIELRR